MKTKFQGVWKSIKDLDTTATISYFWLDPRQDKNAIYVTGQAATASNPDNVPESISAIGKNFMDVDWIGLRKYMNPILSVTYWSYW